MMRPMETGDIKQLAALARIRIQDAEAEQLTRDIDAVLAYVSVVSDITAAGDVTKKVGARFNVFRPDEITNKSGSHTAALMAEAPAQEGNYLKVKKILSQD